MSRCVIYLNRWNSMFHVMLGQIEDDFHRRVRSRFCPSLDEARRVVAHWRAEHAVPPEDIHDNSEIDLDDLFAWMDIDLDATDGEIAGLVR